MSESITPLLYFTFSPNGNNTSLNASLFKHIKKIIPGKIRNFPGIIFSFSGVFFSIPIAGFSPPITEIA